MRRSLLTGVVLLLATVPGAARTPEIVEEFWESAEYEGVRIGSLHTTVRELEGPQGRRFRATEEFALALRRRNTLVQVRMEHGTEEAADGRVLGVFMTQHQGAGRQLTLTGTVEAGRLHYVVDQGRIDRRTWWHELVLGLYGQQRLYRAKKFQPGDTLTYLAYEPTFVAVATRRLRAAGFGEQSSSAGRQKLLRLEQTTDPLPGVKLPPATLWLDDQGVVRRRQIEIDGLGVVNLVRTTRQVAQAAVKDPGDLPDIGRLSLVPLNRSVSQPLLRRQAVYRITVRDEGDAAAAFAQDAHQEARALRGDTFELVVHPLRTPRGPGAERPGPEYLASSYYIDCAAQAFKDRAWQVVGRETDPWEAALRIEQWVHRSLRPDHEAPFVPASQAARTLRGDCRHYAVLTTALCRAADIPARTAVGLLQIERDGRPFLGFHLWTEVFVDGHWRGLDATLGQGGVGVGHLKVADHSWHDTRSLTPFLPVQRLLGKLTVTVVD